jgi:alpha-D-xyloside xylohydrolase
MKAAAPLFTAAISPDGKTEVPFMAWDAFSPGEFNSFPLAYIERNGERKQVMFSLHASHDECFAGTGERFAKMDLAGHTFDLQNADALGVNNRRAYKNIPFFISSRGYGLLILTSAYARLSLGDLSTRAAMGIAEHDTLDLFFIGGGSIERILYNYRRLTGFPQDVPAWSYGMWMGRMSYMKASEVEQSATRLREQQFPCDVMHIDTGWFNEDWACDWQFSAENFPNPERFIANLRERGFRVILWQLPKVSVKTPLFDHSATQGFLPARDAAGSVAGGSNFGSQRYGGSIDLTNPRAVSWYQGLLRKLLDIGVAVIKADFGEEIELGATYHGEDAKDLHNVYALYYQKLIYDVTQSAHPDDAIIWARAGWIGCQRYPIHWAGDAASSWDGLAASIRGGLHLGLSGFGFWSHDVPGFHGAPEFMNTWPSENLYLRWTQAAVFGSHLRYHGAQPREPYEYPGVSDLVRQWLRLRYALIPYLVEQGKKVCRTGFPLLRAMVLHHQDDPVCWHIDDQFFCGDDLLVAPILNARDRRNIYLPAGYWEDFWTGELIEGPKWLYDVSSPPARIPVYARFNSAIPVYPRRVLCTDEMDWSNVELLRFDERYRGLANSSQIGRRSAWEITL